MILELILSARWLDCLLLAESLVGGDMKFKAKASNYEIHVFSYYATVKVGKKTYRGTVFYSDNHGLDFYFKPPLPQEVTDSDEWMEWLTEEKGV